MYLKYEYKKKMMMMMMIQVQKKPIQKTQNKDMSLCLLTETTNKKSVQFEET